jgi:hypothetical protein
MVVHKENGKKATKEKRKCHWRKDAQSTWEPFLKSPSYSK